MSKIAHNIKLPIGLIDINNETKLMKTLTTLFMAILSNILIGQSIDTINYTTVDICIGQQLNGLCHGKGAMTWTSGDIYQGEWKNGLFNGKGRMIWASGEKYIGEWESGQKSGFGIMVWKTGDKYEGEWRKMMHGKRQVILGSRSHI
jgi:hypothetical protein